MKRFAASIDFGVAVARVVAIGRHQDRAPRPDRIGMLALDLVELPAGLEPILAVHLRPGVVVDLLDRALDIDRRRCSRRGRSRPVSRAAAESIRMPNGSCPKCACLQGHALTLIDWRTRPAPACPNRLYAIRPDASRQAPFCGSVRPDPVVRRIGEKRAQQLIVQRMAGFPALEARDDGQTGQFQIAHRVQDLVAHELVREALQRRDSSAYRRRSQACW